jgi:hypothetical protein
VATLPKSDVAPRADLLPSHLLPSTLGSGGIPIISSETSRGRTLRPDDPSLQHEALVAEEQARVSERVQGFVDDSMAQSRVDTGRIHPYFSRLRESLETQMEHPPLFGMPNVPTQLLTSWAQKAKRFGATGSPDGMPVGLAPPTPGERLAERGRDNPKLDSLRARTQAGEELQQFADGIASTRLLVKLELLQAPDGLLRDVKLVAESGNKAYDTYVLKSVPPALEKLGAPPTDAPGVHPEGIRSLWAVEGRVVYLRKLREMKGEDAWYVAAATAAGVLAGRFEETTGDIEVIDVRNPRFVCHSRLLRVY